jgi:hypothetical protein
MDKQKEEKKPRGRAAAKKIPLEMDSELWEMKLISLDDIVTIKITKSQYKMLKKHNIDFGQYKLLTLKKKYAHFLKKW